VRGGQEGLVVNLSVVIPVYNEEAGLPALFARLYPALDALRIEYEVIFVNDGSRDRSAAVLREQFQKRPDVTRVVLLGGNFGQHMAIMAGFERCRGERVVTLDADLQNPPEEIHKLLAKMDQGHDYVGSIRLNRQDPWLRKTLSRAMNATREQITGIRMTDQGCMLRAYSGDIVQAINECREFSTFIPALAYTFAQNPGEVEVAHEERAAGESKYSYYRLVRLNLVVMAKRLIADAGDYTFATFWDRDILQFFLIGIVLFGVGLVGEYVGRIYQQVRHRPRYLVQAVLERESPKQERESTQQQDSTWQRPRPSSSRTTT
jgi:undecaprenyl-phosphate 4-deoxy-4-formamido-L-arabinose transferase